MKGYTMHLEAEAGALLIPSPLVGEGQDGGYETFTPSLTLPREGGEEIPSPLAEEGQDGGYETFTPSLTLPREGGEEIPSPLVGEGQDGGYETHTPSLTLPPQEGEKTPSPLAGEGQDEGYETRTPSLTLPRQGGEKTSAPSMGEGQDGGYETRTPSLTLPRQGGEKTSAPSMGEGQDGGDTLLRRQEGFILPWAIMVTLLGVFIAVPVIVLAGNAFRGHARIEDQIRSFYAADASIHAVMSDLARGADAAPSAPFTYSPPAVSFGADVPVVSVSVIETQTLATVKPINYLVEGNPTVLVGFSPVGGGLDLASDDNSYYKLSDAGTPPSLSYEVTSEVIGFPTVSFGEVRLTALSTKSSTKLEVFIHNPTDPAHTQNGYNPIADLTVILELANTEQTFSVALEDADVTYLNSLSTKRLKIKVVATRTGGFRLDTDQLVFAMAGVVSTDQVNVQGEPLIITGSLPSGSGAALRLDDTTYYAVSSSGNVVAYEVTSSNFSFSSLDKVTVPLIMRSNKDGVVLELFVFNPTDPAHTSGGYAPDPDLSTAIPLNNVDKAVTLTLSQADLAYLNTLFPISMKLKVRASHTSTFQLESDMLLFIATSNAAPTTVIKQITQQYIDPGLKNPSFSTVAAKEGYLLRIYNVRPGLLIINWASHTPDFSLGKTSILVFRGLVIDSGAVVTPGKITSKPPSRDNDLIHAANSRPKQAFVRTGFIDVDTGVYTIVFFNDSSSPMITEPFAATGNKEDAWIYIPAFKDYLVDVQVEKVGLKAVLRQIPGPTEPPNFPWTTTNINWIENLVLIQSWEPYGAGPE